jgi:hypothetical protein
MRLKLRAVLPLFAWASANYIHQTIHTFVVLWPLRKLEEIPTDTAVGEIMKRAKLLLLAEYCFRSEVLARMLRSSAQMDKYMQGTWRM